METRTSLIAFGFFIDHMFNSNKSVWQDTVHGLPRVSIIY